MRRISQTGARTWSLEHCSRLSDKMEEEEEAIRYYFQRNYSYNTILDFLNEFHGINMSKRTLLNRLRGYGLSRRSRNINVDVLRDHINRELQGSGNLLGYRAMWRRLHLKYEINVPRFAVEELLREIDPKVSEAEELIDFKEGDIPIQGRITAGTQTAMTSSNRMGYQYTDASMGLVDV